MESLVGGIPKCYTLEKALKNGDIYREPKKDNIKIDLTCLTCSSYMRSNGDGNGTMCNNDKNNIKSVNSYTKACSEYTWVGTHGSEYQCN